MSREDSKTEMYEPMEWIDPVRTRTDLPTEDVEDDSCCYVEDESAVYIYTEYDGWTLKFSRD